MSTKKTETRRRFINVKTTHDDDFFAAFKRQRRAAAARDELAKLEDEAGLEPAEARRLLKRAPDLIRLVEAGDAFPEDAEILETEDVEVVTIETVSGPRRVFVDRVDTYSEALS